MPQVVMIGLTIALCSFASPSVYAHGAAPAAFDAYVDSEDRVRLVQTNIGLIHQKDGDYRYICPAQWGEEEKMYSGHVEADGDGALIIPVDGAFYRGDGCEFERVEIDAWTGQYGGHHRGIVLERHSSGSRLWHIGNEARLIVSDSRRIDSFLSDGQSIVYGGARPEPWIASWSNGQNSTVPLFGVTSGDYLSIRSTQPVWFSLNRGARTALYEATNEGTPLQLLSERALHGPIPFDGGWIALVDGRIHRKSASPEATFEVFAPTPDVNWTCLVTIGEKPHACQDRGLVRLTLKDGFIEPTPVFTLQQILPPLEQCPADSARQTQCQRQWLHYAAEAGLIRSDAGILNTLSDGGSHDEIDAGASGTSETGGAISKRSGCTVWLGAEPVLPALFLFAILRIIGFRWRKPSRAANS